MFIRENIIEISIIVPVFQVEKYLNRCINSIRNQTFINYECILVDDGSTDSSGIICERIAEQDNRFRVIHKENGGLSSARNTGIEVAKGNYICFIDSDDIIHPQMLEILHKIIIEDNSDLVSSHLKKFNTDYVDFDELEIKTKILQKDEFIEHLYPTNFGEICVSACGKLYKRKIFQNIRYPERLIYEDLHIYLDILMSCNAISIVNCNLYFYYENPLSITRSDYLKHDRFGEFAVRESYIDFFESKGLHDQAMYAANDYLTFFMRNYFAVMIKYPEKKEDFKDYIDIFKGHMEIIQNNPYVCRMRRVCSRMMLIAPRMAYEIAKRTIPDCLIEEMR